jgi:FtsP/CotA-like multicopper oxidase with cupredoxin domain
VSAELSPVSQDPTDKKSGDYNSDAGNDGSDREAGPKSAWVWMVGSPGRFTLSSEAGSNTVESPAGSYRVRCAALDLDDVDRVEIHTDRRT